MEHNECDFVDSKTKKNSMKIFRFSSIFRLTVIGPMVPVGVVAMYVASGYALLNEDEDEEESNRCC